MTVAKLHLENISYRYTDGGVAMFEGLDLSVQTGQVVSIIGTSGVGKTTLFNIAAGLIAPQMGKVIIAEQDRTGKAGFVGYMLQKDLLLPFKSVYDNIALPLTLQGMDKAQIEQLVLPKLALFGLQNLAHKYPHQLSGGQRQRAALLRTYLSNSELMLLDEPFSALDYVTKTEMYAWFNEFRCTHNLTCLIITHDIDEAMYLSDVVYVLKGAPAKLQSAFKIPKTPDFLQSEASIRLKQQILQAIRH